MNHACPLCSADLSRQRPRKIPLRGESRWLALRWHLECPSCGGALQENPHPFEKAVLPVLLLGVGLLNFLTYCFGWKASLPVATACFALVVLGPFVGRAIAVPRDWRRYVPGSQARH
ncbi:hypothetical protein GCM10027082_17790 [Comamonas humi]